MLRVHGLTKWWGDFLALDGVSFEVGKGEVVGFLGPNGAGKTTTMRIITGFIPPTSGEVTVAGFDVFTDSLEVRRRIGYLPENTPMYPDMRVAEYLRFRAQLKGVPSRERAARIGHVVERCMLSEVERKLIGHLSKGFRQRVGLADALLGRPDLMILDEPTAGMDPNQVREVRRLIRELGCDHTILLSTHILPEVEAICSRAVIIHRGKIVAQDEVGTLRGARAAGAVIEVEAVADRVELAKMLTAIPGVTVTHKGEAAGSAEVFRVESTTGADLREEVARAALERGIVLRELRSVTASLEEIFVKYTAGDRASVAVAMEASS
jgi:ABC-2 type transport system ATP-binding protein